MPNQPGRLTEGSDCGALGLVWVGRRCFQITPDEKRSIINYVQTIKTQADPGGAGIGRIGPVSEGLVIWVVGIGALLFGIFWMGSKA